MADCKDDYSMLETRTSILDKDDKFEEVSLGGKRHALLTKAKGFLTNARIRGQPLLHRKHRPLLLKHICGLLMLSFFGVAPIILFSTLPKKQYIDVVNYEESWCGPYGFMKWENDGGAGSYFRALFTIDSGFGSLQFWEAKLIDTIWDLFVGRGVQLVFWLLSYKVFTNALLRSIERSPAPYQTFVGLTLNNGSMSSVIALSKDITRHLSSYNKVLFVVIGICSCYILAIPTLLGTATGYINKSTAWITVPSGDLVKYETIIQHHGWIAPSGSQVGLSDNFCVEDSLLGPSDLLLLYDQVAYCALPTTTLSSDGCSNGSFYSFRAEQCASCNKTYGFAIDGRDYSIIPRSFIQEYDYGDSRNYSLTLADSSGHTTTLDSGADIDDYCYNATSMNHTYFLEHGQCIPEENNYQWGFSTRLGLILVVLQTVIAVSMYTLWLDAEIKSTLVKQGFSLSQLKAAYVLTAATQGDLQSNADEILSVPTRVLENQLHKRNAAVQYKLFQRGFPLANTPAYDNV